jgi:hypothetical protein
VVLVVLVLVLLMMVVVVRGAGAGASAARIRNVHDGHAGVSNAPLVLQPVHCVLVVVHVEARAHVPVLGWVELQRGECSK